MDDMTSRVKTLLRLDEPPEETLIQELIRQGEALILSFTGRASLPPGADCALLRLAVVLYNRLGTEGETSRREGEVTVTMETMPEDIRAMLRPFRLGKAVSLCG